MAYSSLRDFIERLEQAEQLVRVTEPISTHLEMTEIQTRLLAEGGPAVLFENAVRADGTPSPMPVLVNLFGTVERVAWGMEREPNDLRELGEALAFLRQPEPPGGWREALELVPMLRTALAMKPKKKSGAAPCQEVVLTGDDVDLNALPVQMCWPGEPAPLITWPLVVTKGPGDGREDSFNLGVYRLQVTGKNSTLMRWLKHRGGAQHHGRWKAEKSEPLPAAAVIGADPGTILAAVTPVPDTMSEYQFAGLLRNKSVELADCKTQPIQVPANAEIVLEGTVSLADYQDEGPYGDHTGFLQFGGTVPGVYPHRAYPSQRRDLSVNVYGAAPGRAQHLGSGPERCVCTAVAAAISRDRGFLAAAGGLQLSHRGGVDQKTYAGQAKRIMMGVWSYLRQFLYTKWVIVVDDDIDARVWADVMWAISVNMDPARDITLVENTAIDYLDFASPVTGLGSKIGLDATTKIPPETNRTWGTPIRMSSDVIEAIDKKWPDLGLPGSGKAIWK